MSVITMIRHAAEAIGHVWPWWAFGMGLGLAILLLFGLFELKRREILQFIDHLRHWEQ
jgi:hypothetical protein